MKPCIGSELRGFFTAAAVAAAAVLLVASTNLNLPSQDVLQSLRFHMAAAALAIPVLLLAAGARWRAAFMLLIVSGSIVHGGWIIHTQRALRSAEPSGSGSFTILSFNVLASSEQGQNVADYILEVSPDLVIILEAPGIENALERLDQAYPYRIGCETSLHCDLALLSRSPLVNPQMHILTALNRERFITATTTIEGQQIAVAAMHLSKPYNDGAATAELWQISHVLERVRGPLVVAGDFNAAPWSESVSRFMRRNDLVPGPSYPATWPVRLGAFGVPIDNIFTRGGLQIETIEATRENYGSNHLGLLAQISIGGMN